MGLLSGSTLYQLQGERIYKLQELAKERCKVDEGRLNRLSSPITWPAIIPWYIMTSFATEDETKKYFESKNYFGLKKENIIFFNQDLFPCVSEDGKIMLESTSSVCITTFTSSHSRLPWRQMEMVAFGQLCKELELLPTWTNAN